MKYCLKEYSRTLVLDESVNNGFFSGNKFRKLEYLLREKNIKGILTYGSPYSNHCLASAYFGRKLNIPVVLLFLTNNDKEISSFPNIKIAMNLGAIVKKIKTSLASNVIEYYKKQYEDFLWIPGGGHTKQGLNSYYEVFKKIIVENEKLISSINWVLLPFGTGTTTLGIVKALNEIDSNIKVIGVSVSRTKEKCVEACLDFFDEKDLKNLDIITEFSGRYGELEEVDKKYQKKFFDEYEILVDPIYNIRAIRYLYKNNLKNGMIVNTGGNGNLFL